MLTRKNLTIAFNLSSFDRTFETQRELFPTLYGNRSINSRTGNEELSYKSDKKKRCSQLYIHGNEERERREKTSK